MAIVMLPIASCNDNDEPKPLTREESKTVLSTMGTEMGAALGEIMTTPAGVSLMYFASLMGLDDDESPKSIPAIAGKLGETSIVSFIPTISVKVLKPLMGSKDDGSLLNIKGTFSWNFTSNNWDYSIEPANSLIYKFPSNQEQTTNNAMLALTNYTELVEEQESFPTTFDLILEIDDIKALEANYVAQISSNSLKSLSLHLAASPFEISAALLVTSGGSNLVINAGHSIKNMNVTLSSSNIDLVIDGISSINLFDIENDTEIIPSTAKGYLQMGSVKAQLNIDVKKMISVDDDDTATSMEIVAAANKFVDIKMFTYPAGEKMGIIIWEWDSIQNNLVPYFQFNDGTQKPLYEVIGIDLSLLGDI